MPLIPTGYDGFQYVSQNAPKPMTDAERKDWHKGCLGQEPTVHWLANMDTLAVLCESFEPGDKYTLEKNLLTCAKCKELKAPSRR